MVTVLHALTTDSSQLLSNEHLWKQRRQFLVSWDKRHKQRCISLCPFVENNWLQLSGLGGRRHVEARDVDWVAMKV